jgi:hypothetical protein
MGSPAEAAAEMPSTEMAVGEMPATEMPPGEVPAAEMSSAEVPATEVPAEMHASEMAASEAPEMAAAEMHASEMAAAEAPELTAAEAPKMTAAEMTAAPATAEMTAAAAVPKGKSFAYHARHHTRRERYFEAEPERDRCRENFRHPTSHGGLLPPALRNYDPLSVGSTANAWTVPRVPRNFNDALSLYKRREPSTKRT